MPKFFVSYSGLWNTDSGHEISECEISGYVEARDELSAEEFFEEAVHEIIDQGELMAQNVDEEDD